MLPPLHLALAPAPQAYVERYYLPRGNNVKPFPPDFRVIAGDNRLRNFAWDNSIQKSDWASHGLSTNQAFLRQKAIGFNCLN